MKTNPKKGKTITAMVMSAWQQYKDFGYPKDPNCYVLRVPPSKVALLADIQAAHLSVRNVDSSGVSTLPGDRFLMFRVEEDYALEENEVIFGPETIRIEWSE